MNQSGNTKKDIRIRAYTVCELCRLREAIGIAWVHAYESPCGVEGR